MRSSYLNSNVLVSMQVVCDFFRSSKQAMRWKGLLLFDTLSTSGFGLSKDLEGECIYLHKYAYMHMHIGQYMY